MSENRAAYFSRCATARLVIAEAVERRLAGDAEVTPEHAKYLRERVDHLRLTAEAFRTKALGYGDSDRAVKLGRRAREENTRPSLARQMMLASNLKNY